MAAAEPTQTSATIASFAGNAPIREMLEGMLRTGRIPQAMLFVGPEGVGKATLARRFAAAMLGDAAKIEADDLSLPENRARIEERLTLTSEQRGDDPLVFGSHPDFLTFPPEGPLRQISIQQMRSLKEHAQFNPNRGSRRVFLIDELDRANEQAANSLLKILEEPPPYLLLIATASNEFDLLPTIRSRSVLLHLNRLPVEEIRGVLEERGLPAAEIDTRARLAAGCPGRAISLDLADYEKRAETMLTLLEVASGQKPFGEWVRISEATVAKKAERLEDYLEVLLHLLQDVLHLQNGGPLLHHPEYRSSLESVAAKVDLRWLQRASTKAGLINQFLRRNLQKTAALDDFVMELISIGLARS